jgi:flagellar motor switch protein FliG
MYGKGNTIESISISLFDGLEPPYSSRLNSNAINYCNNINALELTNDQWIYASIIGENKKVLLEKPPKFDIINLLDDKALQRILREISSTDLAKALVDCNEETKEKIFKNMSKRPARILREDMDALKDITINEIKSSQESIVEIVKRLTESGEIVFVRA